MEILMIIWAVVLSVAACGFVFSYRLGLRDGRRLSAGKEIHPIIRTARPKPPPSEAERKKRIEIENIMNYTGDAAGQKDVK